MKKIVLVCKLLCLSLLCINESEACNQNLALLEGAALSSFPHGTSHLHYQDPIENFFKVGMMRRKSTLFNMYFDMGQSRNRIESMNTEELTREINDNIEVKLAYIKAYIETKTEALDEQKRQKEQLEIQRKYLETIKEIKELEESIKMQSEYISSVGPETTFQLEHNTTSTYMSEANASEMYENNIATLIKKAELKVLEEKITKFMSNQDCRRKFFQMQRRVVGPQGCSSSFISFKPAETGPLTGKVRDMINVYSCPYDNSAYNGSIEDKIDLLHELAYNILPSVPFALVHTPCEYWNDFEDNDDEGPTYKARKKFANLTPARQELVGQFKDWLEYEDSVQSELLYWSKHRWTVHFYYQEKCEKWQCERQDKEYRSYHGSYIEDRFSRSIWSIMCGFYTQLVACYSNFDFLSSCNYESICLHWPLEEILKENREFPQTCMMHNWLQAGIPDTVIMYLNSKYKNIKEKLRKFDRLNAKDRYRLLYEPTGELYQLEDIFGTSQLCFEYNPDPDADEEVQWHNLCDETFKTQLEIDHYKWCADNNHWDADGILAYHDSFLDNIELACEIHLEYELIYALFARYKETLESLVDKKLDQLRLNQRPPLDKENDDDDCGCESDSI